MNTKNGSIALNRLVCEAVDKAKADQDVGRRLRLWMSDCAARVLPIYEETGKSEAPRKAIIAARIYARAKTSLIDVVLMNAGMASNAAGRAADNAVLNVADKAAKCAAKSASWAGQWNAVAVLAKINAGLAAHNAMEASVRAGGSNESYMIEKEWQLKRLKEWLSENEPDDWPLPIRN